MKTRYYGNSVPTYLKIRSDLHEYPLEDELLIFDGLTKRLFRNNPTATIIWNGCHAGLSLEEIVAVLSEATGEPADRIAGDIKVITTHWQDMGLLHDNRGLSGRGNPFAETGPLSDNIDYDGPMPQLASDGLEHQFRILDTCFNLSVPSENEFRLVLPLLVHLSVSHDNQVDERLYVASAEDRYVLLHQDKVIDWCEDADGIAPMLHGRSLMIAYGLSHCLFGLHAAAVICRGKSVLMPALAGSGKSTLTAALVGSGAALCADDMVLLTAAPVRLRPVPVVIGLKSGSWDLLAPYHPEIASLPTHLRADEKHVRYLAPPAGAMVPMGSPPLPVDVIVIPKFVDAPNAVGLTSISPADGLYRLTEAGFDIRGEMTATCIEQLVDWIARIPCYELHFNQLDSAVSAIQTLVS